ncbi:mannosyltransferase family protein [Diaminobutyricibacter sp. McL0618]|uniref:mannosyltransferase family protein n=1 Tax=Leifsonia sp. McL0618 TaxID=3415677 RepID=UPI003CE97D4F
MGLRDVLVPERTDTAATTRIGIAGRSWPWWMVVLGVYLASRVLTTVFMAGMFVVATAEHWTFASPRSNPDFFTFSGSWDSSYYKQIATQGYPTSIPTDSDGNVEPNAWAFLPLFPLIARAVMVVTGLGFYPAGVIVAVVFGAVAALLLYRLVASVVGATSGLWAAILFCFGPLSFVLQIAYAESLFFALMFAGLWAAMARRYWLVIPFGVAAAFTKPGALAIPLMLAIVFVVRLLRRRRDPSGQPFRRRERIAVVAAGVSTAVAGLAWPLIASAVTGFPGAYLQTELSWWTGFVGRVAFIPLTPWFMLTVKYASVFGALLVFAVIVGFVWMLTRPSVRALGTEVIAYAASFGLYLFAVFLPQQSLFRLLLPLSPLLGAPGLTHSRRARSIVLGAGIALQPVAILLLWFLGYP